MTDIVYKWPALESDPTIFNNYFHDLGLPKRFSFEELISLDYREVQSGLDFINIYGIIVAFQRPKGRYCIEENIIPYSTIPFYMKQSRELDNACGLIAGLHCIGNNLDQINLKESILRSFYEKTKNQSDQERAKTLECSFDLKIKHFKYSQKGQSQIDPINTPYSENGVIRRQVIHHFSSFINIGNNLVELDGTIKGPVLIRKNIGDSILDATIEELRKRINMGVIGEDISVIFLTDT